MTSTSKLEREYGLEEADVAIVRYLAKHPYSTPSGLSRELKIARTTVHFRLSKLAERNFCALKKVRNLSTWSLTSEGLSLLAKANTKIVEMSLTEGAEALDEALLALTADPLPCRIYMFEPSEQTRLFVKNYNEEAYNTVSNLVKKNEIIVEVLFGERTLGYARQMSEAVRSQMYGRPTIGYELPDEILNFESIILCFSEDVYFLNYKMLTVTHVHSKEIASNYRTIFEFYKSFGKKVNFNEELMRTQERVRE